MVIEINKDIERYKESVAMGLTAKQLIFSFASVAVGAVIVLCLYKHIGLTGAAYVAIPCVAPIALGGFYSYNGMDFYEYMSRKLYFMFANRTLTYVSAEGEHLLRNPEAQNGVPKYGQESDLDASVNNRQEDFERMKKKLRNAIVCILSVILIAAFIMAAYRK